MPRTTTPLGRLRVHDCRLPDFVEIVRQSTDLDEYPHATEVTDGVLCYDADGLQAAAANKDERLTLADELGRAFASGPGIAVFRGAFADDAVVDRVTTQFDAIIAEEESGGRVAGDHFAPPGANSRLWNALEKLALRDPESFVDYYANDIVALAATAWLGPNYQLTSAVNVVRPGGRAQEPHRDYHLGFMDDALAERYPTHVHQLSAVLTLQGAVAHTDMPVESGPTMYLPHSQKYLPGYLAWRRPDFVEYFKAHYVQLPLTKGDAVFFNPALFHGAGTNRTANVQRCANLLQVSSAFGRAMETVDRAGVAAAIYPALRERRSAGWASAALTNVIAAAAEGYPFPTNLDRDQPRGRLTPPSQAEVLRTLLERDADPATVDEALTTQAAKHRSR